MELLEIIFISLKLFSASSLIVILLSYFFYKVKSRGRLKPYVRLGIDLASETLEEDEEKIQAANNQFLLRPNKFKIINENKTELRERAFRGDENYSEELQMIQEDIITEETLQYFNEEELDIYKYYSNNTFQPMHKLNLSGLS